MLACSRVAAAVSSTLARSAAGSQSLQASVFALRITKTLQHRSPSCRCLSAKAAEAPAAAASLEGLDVEGAKRTLALAQAVCFDVDSTVCTEEGIDVLAEFCGAAKAVAALTNQAMGGTMLFQDAIKARLDLMKPSAAIVKRCLAEHPPQLSPGMADLAAALQARGTAVYLVSGGFRSMIDPVAAQLDIPLSRVYANRILFSSDGSYAGFDANEPTSRDGGKAAVIKSLKAKYGYKPVVMVGDGATDMQAKPPAEAFIGYGGVAVRPAVQQGADWYIYDLQDMIDVVKEAPPLAQ